MSADGTPTGTSAACIAPNANAPDLFAPGSVTIAATGDVLMHVLLQEDAAQQPRGYAAQFTHVAPYLALSDLTIANLEGPAAQDVLPGGRDGVAGAGLFDGRVYSGYPTFNYHPSLITALDGAGVDILQLANNHALDRGPLGLDRTIANVNAAGLGHTGVRPRSAPNAPWYHVAEANGHSIAFLACTFSTNGQPDPNGQVLQCYRDEAALLAQIRSLSADPQIDATILLPHWGAEYTHTPDANQRRLARAAAEAGATAIIGTHPHVLQPIEQIGDVPVAYSLGNFISSQWALGQRSSVILYLTLIPDGSGSLVAQPPSYLPTRVTRYTSGIVVQPAEQAVDGNQSVAHVRQILGEGGLLSLADIAGATGRAICVSP